jgi:vanillate/3-O-methylgallate O-demethylase
MSTVRSLQELIDSTPDLVGYLYNDTPGPHSRGRGDLSPVPAEFTNWRDEQRAWNETAILFDQSHHMPELFISGPDAKPMISSLVVNSLANLDPGRAKQVVACTPSGHYIGDSILYDLGDGTYELVSSMPLLNWVEYQAQAGGWDVRVERDNNTSDNPAGRRRKFRFQVDGPHAREIFAEVVDGEAPEIKFFRVAELAIAGRPVRVLRHGMAGHSGVEISGAYDDGAAVRDAIVAAGAGYGLLQGGNTAYFTALYESAWIAYPLPGIYTGEELRGYREWLPADSWEGRFQIAGSFVSPSVEDYYNTPYDLGYGHLVKFDHDFTGRAALEKIAAEPHRTKVSLVWDTDDVLAIYRSLFEDGLPYKYIDLPLADYGSLVHRDEVRASDGRLVGLSTFTGYTVNLRAFLSIALVDPGHAAPGERVTVLWGEPDGGSRKARVERHRQFVAHATVAPAPYSANVRQMQKSSV